MANNPSSGSINGTKLTRTNMMTDQKKATSVGGSVDDMPNRDGKTAPTPRTLGPRNA